MLIFFSGIAGNRKRCLHKKNWLRSRGCKDKWKVRKKPYLLYLISYRILFQVLIILIIAGVLIFKVNFYHSWRVLFLSSEKVFQRHSYIVFSVFLFSFQNRIESYIGLLFVSLVCMCTEKDPSMVNCGDML